MSESFRHLWGRTGDATPPTPDSRERGEAITETYLRAADIIARAPLINTPSSMEHLARAYRALRAPAPSEAVGALNYLRECVDAMREGRDGDGVFSQKAYELLDELAALRAPAPREAVAEDDPRTPDCAVQVRVNLWCPQGHLRTITTSCACTPDPRERGEVPPDRLLTMAEVAQLCLRRHADNGSVMSYADARAVEAAVLAKVAALRAFARGVTVEEREVMGDLALEGFIDWCDLDPTSLNALTASAAREYLALRQKSRTPDAEGGR